MKRPSKHHQIFHTQLATMQKGDSRSDSVMDLNKEGEHAESEHARGDGIMLEERELGSRDENKDEEELGGIDEHWHEGGEQGMPMKTMDAYSGNGK